MKQTKARRRKKKKDQNWLGETLDQVKALLARALGLIRSLQAQRTPRRMQLIERVSLSNKHSVSLLRVDNQEFVVGCTGETIVLLGVHEPHTEPRGIPTAEELVNSFRSVQ